MLPNLLVSKYEPLGSKETAIDDGDGGGLS